MKSRWLGRCISASLLVVCVAIDCVAIDFGCGPAAAQTPANPLVQLKYVRPRSAALEGIADRVKKYQVLEQFGWFLVPLRLPKQLDIQFDECGASTRPYQRGGPVTICYELMTKIEQVAAKADPDIRDRVLVGAIIQAIFHETAPAVFHLLKVPIWGRPDDASDRLAGFLMVEFGSDLAAQLITGTAAFFKESDKTWTGSDFAAPQSPEAQRFYNYLCMAYGSAPTFVSFRDSDSPGGFVLPADRERKCPKEFEQVRKSFNLRIMPYVDPDLLIHIRAHPWAISLGVTP